MKNCLSTSELRNVLDNKWKEYKNIYENGHTLKERNAAHKGMMVVRSVEKELLDQAAKKSS